jgi:hypothetical protein
MLLERRRPGVFFRRRGDEDFRVAAGHRVAADDARGHTTRLMTKPSS